MLGYSIEFLDGKGDPESQAKMEELRSKLKTGKPNGFQANFNKGSRGELFFS